MKKILDYVEETIVFKLDSNLNNCTRYIALKDLNSLVKAEVIRHGIKASSIYLPINKKKV